MKVNFDIDIDLANRDILLSQLSHVVAKLDSGSKHNTGVYFQNIPSNPFNNLATFNHKDAADVGYVKVDFLNLYIYEDVKSESHLIELTKEPNWNLLEYKEVVEQLMHISKYFHIVEKIKPKSVEDLAIVLSLIRPSKKHLLNEPIEIIKKEIWKRPTDGSYYYKKSHSISYALAIVVQLNLLEESV